jgi:hypothetical protein
VRDVTWKDQSKFTDPGAAGPVIDELPADLTALREASSQLVFHYRGDGDWAENGVPAERAGEIDTRYADAMFAVLLSRGEPTLARKRLPPDRVVGCCRDATLLFVSLARHKGIPARMRVGFAAYLQPGLLIDHVVAEAWDEAAGRWRLIDGEMNSNWTPEVGGNPVDWTDLARDQFVTGPDAWQAARAGTCDPERHLTSPDLDAPELRGWPLLARHVIHDLVALNKTRCCSTRSASTRPTPASPPTSSPRSPAGKSCASRPPSPVSTPTAAHRARSPSAHDTPPTTSRL